MQPLSDFRMHPPLKHPFPPSLRQLKKAAEERKAAAEKGGGGGDRWHHDRFGREDNEDDEDERVRRHIRTHENNGHIYQLACLSSCHNRPSIGTSFNFVAELPT